jgi:hypothetical protein
VAGLPPALAPQKCHYATDPASHGAGEASDTVIEGGPGSGSTELNWVTSGIWVNTGAIVAFCVVGCHYMKTSCMGMSFSTGKKDESLKLLKIALSKSRKG